MIRPAPTLRTPSRSTPRTPPRRRGALAALATLVTVATLAAPAAGVTAAGGCLDGFAAVAIGDATEFTARVADRNGDGLVCGVVVNRRDGSRLTVLTDDFIGDPGIAPAPCTAPFTAVGIGHPEELPAAVQRALGAIDANRDGALCVSTTRWSDPSQHVLVVVDNPNNLHVTGATAT